MRAFEIESMHDGYTELVNGLVSEGSRSTSRVGNVVELEDVSILIHDTWRALPPSRKGFAPLLGFAEGCQLAGGFAADETMLELFPGMAAFTDFYGTYGKRSGISIQAVLDALRTSPDTRRAVVGLWDAKLDVKGEYRDHPCTLAINFRIRDDKLNMTVHMRSNDVVRGLQYDSIQFSLLHVTIAEILGIQTGTYVHHADSLHLYERDFDVVESLYEYEKNRNVNAERIPYISPLALFGWEADQLSMEAQYALGGYHELTETEQGTQIARLVEQRKEKLRGK